MKLVIDMPWERDLSVNHCNMGPRGNWHLKRDPEAWKDRLGWEVLEAHIAVTRDLEAYAIAFPVNVAVNMRFPDRRLRDSHNYHYLIANGVAAGLRIDDKDIRIRTGSVSVDRENPGFTITVTDEEQD